MAENITFRGAIIRGFDVRQGQEGADTFVRLHMSADFSQQVCERMEWDDISEAVVKGDLKGSLSAINFILTPGDKSLRGHELNFNIKSVEEFKLKSKKSGDADEDTRDRHLEFTVLTPVEIEGFIGAYIRRVGRHAGQLKIGYTVQDKLDLGEKKADTKPASDEPDEAELDTGCILCNNRVPLESEGLHANGQKCTRETGSSTLASAREVGGTHQKGRKQRTAPVPDPDPEAAVSDPVH